MAAPTAVMHGGKTGLWQMCDSEREEGWSDSGSAFLGREVCRSTSTTAQSIGVIYCWLPPTVDDPYVDDAGAPAPLFKVRFLVGELDGDVEDLELRQVVESLVTVPVLEKKKKPAKRKAPAPEEEEDDDDGDDDGEEEEAAGDDDSEFEDEPAPKKKKKARKAAPRKAPAKKKKPSPREDDDEAAASDDDEAAAPEEEEYDEEDDEAAAPEEEEDEDEDDEDEDDEDDAAAAPGAERVQVREKLAFASPASAPDDSDTDLEGH